MDLGAFSVSLTVKDLAISRAFYEKLGFEVTGGSEEHSYLILVNQGAVIGLFQGMFEKNILTFNPGLGGPGMEQLEGFTDVREIQRSLKSAGIELTEEVDESTSGPAHIAFLDPDENPILIDQFF
jgi:catechol 2,3-dioxygenase-like lactoylglutathione lyase family enzyme